MSGRGRGRGVGGRPGSSAGKKETRNPVSNTWDGGRACVGAPKRGGGGGAFGGGSMDRFSGAVGFGSMSGGGMGGGGMGGGMGGGISTSNEVSGDNPLANAMSGRRR